MAFRAASGDYLASTVTGNHRPRFATFARPTDATGTKGEFKGEVTGIVASFDFTPENPQVKLDTRTLGHFGHPIPRGAHPWQASVAVCLGCPWDPTNSACQWPRYKPSTKQARQCTLGHLLGYSPMGSLDRCTPRGAYLSSLRHWQTRGPWERIFGRHCMAGQLDSS